MPEETKQAVAETFDVEVTNPENGNVNKVKIVKVIPAKGRAQGIPKFLPENFDTLGLDWFVSIWGAKQVLRTFVKPRAKQMFGNFTADALVKDDGKTPESDIAKQTSDYSEMFSKLSLRGETLADISSRISEITGDNEEDGELMQAISAENMVLAKELKAELTELRKAYSQKKAARAEKKPEASATQPTAQPVTA